MTDVEGSTRLWEQFPEAMRAALQRHGGLIAECVAQNGGLLVKARGEGDSTFSVFSETLAAVQAAADIQRVFAEESWPAQAPLRVRAALHTGHAPLTQEENLSADYSSVDVNRCARLRALACGGQTLLSQTAFGLVQDNLPSGIRLQSLGSHRLKDLTRPEEIFQLVQNGLPHDFPPLPSSGSFASNLPLSLTRFVGRSRELADVRRLLGETRLLTLTGSGGAGKTRLALQVGDEMHGQFEHGVWLVELAALTDPALIDQEIARAIGVREEPGQPLSVTLGTYLQPKALLLILDNCEHLLDGCARLAARLLRACPHLRLLTTSREPLGVGGETSWAVPPLSSPNRLESLSLEQLGQYEAVQLLVDRATAVQPAFVLSAGNASAVAQVCRRLDGIPLALELAAARVRSLSMDQVAQRMDDRFRLLTGGSRTALPRQQTLRAVIDWSYDLLTETERTLLGRLSIFAGGWTLEAAEAVCAGDDIYSEDVLDLLSQLVSKSLVTIEETSLSENSAVRYFLPETLRQYSAGKLRETFDEGRDLSARALDYFLALSEDAESYLDGPQEAEWRNRLEAEQDNVRAALEWAREHHPEACLRLAGALYWFWFVRGYGSEWRGWLESALECGTEVSPKVRVKAVNGAGILAWSQGDLAAAQALYEQALALQRERGNRAGEAGVLNNLAGVACDEGDYEAARAWYMESLRIYREIGDQGNVAKLLSNLGQFATLTNSLDEAASLLQESLAMLRRLDHFSDTGVALENLGDVERIRGSIEQARAYYLESLRVSESLGDRLYLARLVHALGLLTLAEGESRRACFRLGFAEARRLEIGTVLTETDQKRLAEALSTLNGALGEDERRLHWSRGAETATSQMLQMIREEKG